MDSDDLVAFDFLVGAMVVDLWASPDAFKLTLSYGSGLWMIGLIDCRG